MAGAGKAGQRGGNLAQANQQLVKVEWDINWNWRRWRSAGRMACLASISFIRSFLSEAADGAGQAED